MRGQAAFSHVVHPLCPYLYLQIAAFLVLYGDMQRLVSVRLRIGYPVTKTLCVGLIFLCHIREYLPAQSMLCLPVLLAVDDEPYGKHIVDSVEAHLLFLHLFIYGQSCLRSHFQLILYALIRELLLERFDELRHQLLPVFLCALELVCDGPVLLRICMTEEDILHLALYII